LCNAEVDLLRKFILLSELRFLTLFFPIFLGSSVSSDNTRVLTMGTFGCRFLSIVWDYIQTEGWPCHTHFCWDLGCDKINLPSRHFLFPLVLRLNRHVPFSKNLRTSLPVISTVKCSTTDSSFIMSRPNQMQSSSSDKERTHLVNQLILAFHFHLFFSFLSSWQKKKRKSQT